MTETDEEAPHILVVDDDARLRQLLHRYLVLSGYFATTAADAAEAKARAKSIAFDLIVLDIMMPGQDGLALTEELRGESAGSRKARVTSPAPDAWQPAGLPSRRPRSSHTGVPARSGRHP